MPPILSIRPICHEFSLKRPYRPPTTTYAMNTPLNTILVAIDFSTGSRAALEQAARIAKKHGSKLHVLNVIDSAALASVADHHGESFESAARTMTEGGSKALDTWLAHSQLPDGYEVTIVVGAPLHEILEHTKSLQADLLVAGIAGAGEHPAGAGSVSTKLARKSTVNVLLVRASHPHPFQRLLACIDFSEHSQRVASVAREIALQDGASVDFVTVWADPGAMLPAYGIGGEMGFGGGVSSMPSRDELIASLCAELHGFVEKEGQGITSTESLCEDMSVGRAVVTHAKESEADLIVIGALGGTNLRYLFLGSTAERVLTHLPCSVLVVKPVDA